MKFRAAFTLLIASFAAACSAWTISSRELVDVQFSADDSLIILASAPNAIDPGIYHWQRDAETPTLLCRIASPTAFSFDRKTIIERAAGVAGAASELRLYSPSTCQMLDHIKIDGRVVDVDVRGELIAVALRLPDSPNELRVYRHRTKSARNDAVLARALIGRNIEMGFAPDGLSIVNFDFSDDGVAAWRVPSLASHKLPTWMAKGETTFVPGSTFVKQYVSDALSVVRWPTGAPIHTMAAPRTVRLRQLSATGRFGALHSFDAPNAAGQSLDWVDFATQKRVNLATGSIDNAAINAAGNRMAWVLRSSELMDQVSVQLAQIDAAGNAVATSGAK